MPSKVSVIIPAYNAEKMISHAIESILAQAGGYDLGILVSDDGSTDGTRSVVSRLAEQHPQIILLRNAGRKGPAGGRNTCLLQATGEYVSFLYAESRRNY